MPKWIIFLFALALLSHQRAQAQFQLNGNAVQLNDSCYQLTQTFDFIAGSIWNLDQINLNNSFEVVMDIFLGCQDASGADGIVFGFQPVSTSVGTPGGGIGFEGISPSIGFEFDTYQNGDLSDPAFDHMALISNGNLNHASNTNLAGPVQASVNNGNIEDCEYHELRVSWNANTFELAAYFDCELRLSYTGDIVNTIFGGNPNVFWGFTAATGALNNTHQICFTYTTFLDQLEDVVLCPNGQVQLQASSGFDDYSWTPATGLSNPLVANPIASPTATTTYIVEIQDACSIPLYDTVLVMVDGDSSFVELGPDTLFCTNESFQLDASTPNATYLWNTGATTPQIDLSTGGFYQVTVTIDDYCFDSDFVTMEALNPPTVVLPDDPVLCIGTPFRADVQGGTPYTSYDWNTGATGAVLEILEAGSYSVTATNICGTDDGGFAIELEDCQQLFIPNVFSPNFDGINDYFLLQDNGDVRNIRYLRIYDRWGELVFSQANILPNERTTSWDGTFRGERMPVGVYLWILEVEFRDGVVQERAGSLQLLR